MEVNCNADATVITTTNGTPTVPPGCNDSVVYCVFRPNSTAQGLDTWEIDADQEGFCVNRNAWKERRGSLYSQSSVNALSCPLSIEALALIQSVTETNVVRSGCNVTVAESRPSSARILFQRPTAFRTISSESDEQSCEDITANRFNSEESCLTSLSAFFLNASSNVVKIEEIDCDAAQNVIGFRLRRHDESPKGTLGHPLCGGTEWEIFIARAQRFDDLSPTVSTPAKDCEAFYNSQRRCNLAGGGVLKVVDGSTARITINFFPKLPMQSKNWVNSKL
ncbi:uncharacterized protein [Oscarella lobularis]|uniref:uncharacterized protein isoform X2 n=1 Tax=Oscarella lobularis TaxID=121494 RepID=UPI0033142038